MTTTLTLPQRAALALGTAEHEVKLIALAQESSDIVAVANVAAREQAHRIGMNLRATRTTIQKIGKDARDDATKFSKAIIAEEDRLIAIIQPEEARVIGLRDGFDAEEKARKDALIAAERDRLSRIASAIEALREGETDALRICKTADSVRREIEYVEAKEISKEIYQERLAEAIEVQAAVLASMRSTLAFRIESEAEAARQKAEREAAAEQAQKEREELAAAQAELKRLQEERAETERKNAAYLAKVRADADAALEAERATIKAASDAAEAERLRQQQATDASNEAARLERERVEQENADLRAQLAAVHAPNQEVKIAPTVEHPIEVLQLASGPLKVIPFTQRPTDDCIVDVIAQHYGVPHSVANEWLCEFEGVAA